MKYLISERKQSKIDLVFMNNFNKNKINYENNKNKINYENDNFYTNNNAHVI